MNQHKISQESVHIIERRYSKGILKLLLLLRTNFLLLHITVNYFTTTVFNFSRGALTKHILKNIGGESTLSKLQETSPQVFSCESANSFFIEHL